MVRAQEYLLNGWMTMLVSTDMTWHLLIVEAGIVSPAVIALGWGWDC